MMSMQQYNELERRRYPRFGTVPHQSYILLQGERKTGELIDISMGGAAFHYLSEKPYPGGSLYLSTLLGSDDLCISGLGMTTVADESIFRLRNWGHPLLRRRSVKFVDLTPDQRSLLRQFIWLNTREETPSVPPLQVRRRQTGEIFHQHR